MYPNITDRIKSAFFDGMVIIVMLLITSQIVSIIGLVSVSTKMILLVCIFFLYDPISTSLFGGTIGHHILGIRVKRLDDESSNINFLKAIIRFVFKTLLGWISLVTISRKKKNRAIHDLIVNSIVTYK